jgi:hypothetical protein
VGGLAADIKDKDEAVVHHQLGSKGRQDQRYTPEDGFTTSAPQFKDDIDALLLLSNFDLPPLQVVRPAQVVHVYNGFRDTSGKQFGATAIRSLVRMQRSMEGSDSG